MNAIAPNARTRSRAPAPSTNTQQTAPAPAGGGIRPTARTTTAPTGAGAANANSDWMKRGDVARAASEQERARQQALSEQRQANRLIPFRYWLPVGGEGDIVILDSEIGPCFWEHNLRNARTNKWDTFEACPHEWDHCPLCEAAQANSQGPIKAATYNMYLTVMDMRPYTPTQGPRAGQTIPHSKKLLVVKAQQHGFFMRLFDRHGTLRGVHLLMTRDTQQTFSVGTPEFQAIYGEEDILATFGHPERRDSQTGQVIAAANADCYPLDYATAFRRPSGDDLRTRYGGSAPAGSRRETEDEWNRAGQQTGNAAPRNEEPPFEGGRPIQGAQAGGGIRPRSQNPSAEGAGDVDDVPL